MEQINLNKLVLIKSILDNSFYYPRYTFFNYHLQRKQLEIFKNSLKDELKIRIINIKTKPKKKKYGWVKRIAVSLAIMSFSYFFMNIPNAVACETILKNKIVITSIWSILVKTKEIKKEKKSSYVSKKVLILGSVAVSLAIGAILFHQMGMSRKLFSPKLEELAINTIPEIDLLNKINFEENISTRRLMFNKIIKAFGKSNFFNLLNGEVKIDCLNNQQVFILLARLLKQATELTKYEAFLKGIDGIEKYVNASRLEDLNEMKEILVGGLNRIIAYNPNRLLLFKDHMDKVLMIVEAGKALTFTKEMEKALVTDLIGYYLYQNVLEAMKPYYGK